MKTEFEVEGWRKITPLMRILEKYFSPDELANIRLEMKANESITIPVYSVQFIAKKFKKWIYDHFKNESTKDTKITLYINEYIPINQILYELVPNSINTVGNHCVIVKGIKPWKHQFNQNEKFHEVECFEIEDFGESEQTRFIPVDFPCFEEIQDQVNKILNKHFENSPSHLNQMGHKWAIKKYGSLEKNWFDQKTKSNRIIDDKYPMFFFRCFDPCFQLKFNVSS